MKTIILFIAGLFLVNQAMAQCTGGSISGPYSEICVGTTTGIMELSGYSGSISEWQYSTNGGSSWTSTFNSSYQYSDVLITTGTYLFRVKMACGSPDYSTTKTITVKNAVGGTISSGGGTICTGGSPTALTLTSEFVGPGGVLYWEYSTNGGSSYSVDGSGTNTNPYTPYLSYLGGAGTYIYRARATCGISSDSYSNNTKTYQVNSATTAAICNDADDLRKAIAKVHISGIPYDFSGFLVNHTAQDGRLLFLTTSHPFMRYSPSSSTLNSATFTWNEDLTACTGGSATTPVVSVGCTLLVTDGFFTLLELNAAPDLAELYYLGWDINATGNYNSIFQSAGSIKKGKVSTTGSPSIVTGSFATGTDNFTESSGSGVYKFSSWTSGNTEMRGRGAPLLAGSVGKKARGVYLGGDEASCGNGPSYFVYLASSYTSLLSKLRDGSETNTATVYMNYCKPSEMLSGVQPDSKEFYVTGSIVSTQAIEDGYIVGYHAGTFIELNNGFYSGTNFVAEINPCVITRTEIAAKTEDIIEEPQQNLNNIAPAGIKIYPTIIASDKAITVEVTEAQQELQINVYDLQGKKILQFTLHNLNANEPSSVLLNGTAAGFYLVKAEGNTISTTQKIIVK